MQPGPPNSPAPLPPQAQLAAPPSFPPLFQSLAVVGTLCLVLNQSSSTIDLETVRSATAEALGVWDARVVNPSISTPCFFYPLWCEKQSLEQSIQSLPLQAGVAGVTFSAHENEVRVPLGGTIPIPFSTLANDGASDATSTVVSLELVDYKPSVSQRRTPTSPLCLAEDTCDFCACKNMCYTGMLGKLYGSSGDGAGFSRSAVDALESASGVGVQFASFDSLLSRGAGGGASSITFEALGAAPFSAPPMEFSGGSRRGSCELQMQAQQQLQQLQSSPAGSTRSSASIGQPMTSSYSSFMPIPGVGGGGAAPAPAAAAAGGGSVGGSGTLPPPLAPLASTGAGNDSSPQGFLMAERKVSHVVRLSGNGTFLSPFWVEIDDFVIYDALFTTFDTSASTVAACLNAGLRSLVGEGRTWETELTRLLWVVEAIHQHHWAAGRSVDDSPQAERRSPPRIALVRSTPPASDARSDEGGGGILGTGHGGRFVLSFLIGTGEPTHWALPAGASLLTLDSVSGSAEPAWPALLDFGCRVVFGHFRPHKRNALASATLLLLILLETLLNVLVLSALGQMPDTLTTYGFIATLLVLPMAGVVSPIAVLGCWLSVMVDESGAHKGRDRSISAIASGRVVRRLRLGALWNASSLPNALVSLACFVPLALHEHDDPFRAFLLWLLPLLLVAAKLLQAQAFKALAASVGVTGPVSTILQCAEALAAEHASGVAARQDSDSRQARASTVENEARAAFNRQ